MRMVALVNDAPPRAERVCFAVGSRITSALGSNVEAEFAEEVEDSGRFMTALDGNLLKRNGRKMVKLKRIARVMTARDVY